MRGDVNSDDTRDLADAVCVLTYLFGKEDEDPRTQAVLKCLDAADANDDGKVSTADAIRMAKHFFGYTGPLPEPFNQCGYDATEDEIRCLQARDCE